MLRSRKFVLGLMERFRGRCSLCEVLGVMCIEFGGLGFRV